MKKFLALLLAGVMLLAVTACAKTNEEETVAPAADPLEVLDAVWNAYEGDKFSAMGGDFSEENQTEGKPGKYGIDDADAFGYDLVFPVDCIDLIDDAASIKHMMNANTFTGVAVRVVDAGNVDALTEKIKENVLQNPWMCGFPDMLVIATVDNVIVYAFGAEDLINSFSAAISVAYASAAIVCSEPIV